MINRKPVYNKAIYNNSFVNASKDTKNVRFERDWQPIVGLDQS